MYECNKNQVLYCNVKNFKKWNLWEFWAIDKTWLALDKFYYYYFHKWKKTKNLNAYIKLETKLFHLTWKKEGNLRQVIGKLGGKNEFEYVKSESMFQRHYPNHALTHLLVQNKALTWKNKIFHNWILWIEFFCYVWFLCMIIFSCCIANFVNYSRNSKCWSQPK
jgi:hypothetical protein